MKQRMYWASALVFAGMVISTAAGAETSPANQLRWDRCYRSCEVSYGSTEASTGKKFKACVARCEDKWLSTMGPRQTKAE